MADTIIVTTPEQIKEIITQVMQQSLPTVNRVPQEKKLLSPTDAAKEYNLNKRTLERWRYEGTSPAYTTMGRRIYYERDVLEKYIADGRVQSGV